MYFCHKGIIWSSLLGSAQSQAPKCTAQLIAVVHLTLEAVEKGTSQSDLHGMVLLALVVVSGGRDNWRGREKQVALGLKQADSETNSYRTLQLSPEGWRGWQQPGWYMLSGFNSPQNCYILGEVFL